MLTPEPVWSGDLEAIDLAHIDPGIGPTRVRPVSALLP
jgi:hypothetical protein